MQDPTRRPASKKDGIAAVLEKVKVSKEVSNLLSMYCKKDLYLFCFFKTSVFSSGIGNGRGLLFSCFFLLHYLSIGP